MTTYWIDYVQSLWPKLVLMSGSALPLAIGTGLAVIHLRRNKPQPYLRYLWGSIAAGIVALGLLWGSLFGDDLSSSSTAALIFIFVPIYSAIGFGVGYGLGALLQLAQLAYRKTTGGTHDPGVKPTISRWAKRFVWVPIVVLMVLLFGMFQGSVQNNKTSIAERSTNLEVLRELYQETLNGTADSFSVPLFLAQNPSTPADVLEGLSQHYHTEVRIFVVRHPNLSQATLNHMLNDRSIYIREEAQARGSTDPEILRELYRKALNGTANSYGVPLSLAQNPNTPADILEGLSQHEYADVRMFAARHPRRAK